MPVADTNQLRQDRQKLVVLFRELNDGVRERGVETAEETEKFEKMNAEIDALTRKIDREETLIKHEADAARSALSAGNGSVRTVATPSSTGLRYPGNTQHRLRNASQEEIDRHMPFAIQGWLRAMRPDAEFDPEHLDAAKFFGMDLRSKEIALPITRDYRRRQKEFRDMSLTPASGGTTVPQGFVDALEVALLQFGFVRQVASIIRTTSGNDLPWPTMNDTANKGAILAEATTFGSSVDPTFSSVIFKAFKYSSKPIIVSNELLQDSAFDLAAMMGGWLGERIGRIQNDHFTTGAGTTLPKGLTVAGVVGKAAASMTTFTDVELIDLEHSVDPAYRPGASWMFHDLVLAQIRKLKDVTSGQYLWQPGLQAGNPDRLLGYTYTINQSMSSTFTTGQKLVLFGDMSKYKIRDVQEIRLVRLDELFALTDQVGFVGFLRSDGNLLDAGTRPVKWLALA